MRIKLITIMAGPTGALLPGEHEVADDLGHRLCNLGYAEPLGLVAPIGFHPIESAAIEPPERAVLPQPAKRKLSK